jgi:uncharacterized protein with von Willebrand factor type A (vWA) domain
MLLERKRKILEKYEVDSVQQKAARSYRDLGKAMSPPRTLRKPFEQAYRDEQIYDFERLWYSIGDDTSRFAGQLMKLIERLGQKYEIDELAAKYQFTGQTPMTIEEAIQIKEELEKIDKLLEQLEKARETAQIGVVDMDALAEFAEPGDLSQLETLRNYIENYVREMAERQGLERDDRGAYRLTPKAYRLFQGRLLEKIFNDLQAGRTGRHTGPIVGEGAVETQRTKPYEFGDSLAHMDIPQTFVNAMLRSGAKLPLRLKTEDIEVHRTRNSPKCATVVVMDMSGSMRYDGQYINVKRMALALEGLIRKEWPGDYLQFVEMATFCKPCLAPKIAELMPKYPTLHDPIVRLRADMSDERISEYQIPPHFTNIQHGLQMARQYLALQDTPNRQVILITDGLPTAHFEGSEIYLLYPPDPRTEHATMREGLLCQRDGVTINIFLVPSWSQSEDDIRFAYRLAESTKGRVIFTAGRDLDRFVVWDYIHRKREIVA